jgi:RNA polymerase-binding transcription factor DksA
MQVSVVLNNLPKNPALRSVIKSKCLEHNDILKTLEKLQMDILQLDTRHGDPVDCANNESLLEDLHRKRAIEQLRLRKIESVVDILRDTCYEGLCSACEDDVLLTRIMRYNSTLCPACAKRAETY